MNQDGSFKVVVTGFKNAKTVNLLTYCEICKEKHAKSCLTSSLPGAFWVNIKISTNIYSSNQPSSVCAIPWCVILYRDGVKKGPYQNNSELMPWESNKPIIPWWLLQQNLGKVSISSPSNCLKVCNIQKMCSKALEKLQTSSKSQIVKWSHCATLLHLRHRINPSSSHESFRSDPPPGRSMSIRDTSWN